MMQEFWNEKFSPESYFYGVDANDFLKSVYGVFSPKGKILCIAEGEGRNSVFLARQSLDVYAVDFSEVAKKKALDLASKENVALHYDLCSLQDFDFGEEKWDGVVSIFCHLPHDIRSMIHQKIQKSLRPGGIFLIEAYHPTQLEYKTGGPNNPEMLYTEKLLEGDFSDLQWIKLDKSLRDIQEGKGHSGMSATVQGIGVKK